jgi:mono/diheme cytochrome c family protein
LNIWKKQNKEKIMLRKNINLKVSIALLVTAIMCINTFAANNWNVPADKKEKNSYIKFDATSGSQGEAIYTKNCASCHGNPGKNNSLKSLSPVPPDLSSAQTQELTDGELFYILSTGRMVMPSFKNVLSEDERWKVISYIRSFNKSGYAQTVSKFDPNKSKLVKVDLKFDETTNKVQVSVVANEKTGKIVLKDAEIALFATRYFGRLQIEKSTRTDKDGIASFTFPKNLPGDKTGLVELVVKLNDENYGEIEYLKKLKIGVPTDKPALTAKRAIWNVVTKAPFWIIGLYSFGLLCFGLILLYILLKLRKLYKSSNN